MRSPWSWRWRVEVGARSWIGSRTILLPGTRLGEGAVVGAGAVVNFEVQPYAVAAGNPARVVGWTSPGRG